MCIFFLATSGYLITPNATEYEFDVSVYSPNETVVFGALLIAENITKFSTIRVNFAGAATEFGPFSINGMDTEIQFPPPITTNPLLTIRLNETLHLNDDQVDYEFTLNYFAAGVMIIKSGSVNVILHEIGMLVSGTRVCI